MAGTVSQADRIEGERQHGTAITPVVDRYYRLQPVDLGGLYGEPRIVVVRQVGAQGFEQPQPILHLAGIAKPLLMDVRNVAALAQIAASPLQRDWVGREVALVVVSEGGALAIRLFAPSDPTVERLRRKSQAAVRARTMTLWLRQLFRYTLLLLSLLVVGGVALYLVENWAMLLELGSTLLEGLLNPT
jgi:hypothetical protein